ncbi:MAG TPA: SgcJ/EcaC family oxidoreductase [Acidimicrobiales bacterium]|nr:SgcJ/EcaC family oxidoreductase [Acidimicrobiales bacterium]
MPNPTTTHAATPTDAAPQDVVQAAEAVVAELQRAQQHEDVDAFVALFRDDAVWTTAGGRRLVGRDEIAAFTATVLPGAMRESTARYDVDHVVLVRPDVAVVQVRQIPITHDGAQLADQPEGRPTYVLAKEGERWLLVAGQNTQVAL